MDNTFASPALQQPLTLGADIVLHSTTKYIGGHSDVVGGALVTNDEELDERVRFPAERRGRGAGPVRRLSDHARAQDAGRCGCSGTATTPRLVAEFLENHPAIETVLYPGLPSHPGHDVAAKQMSASAAWCRCGCAGGRQAARDFCSRTEVFILAESLGGVESLIEHPGAMTHASTAGSQLEVPDDLVRLSVGIEDAADLLADLEQALR